MLYLLFNKKLRFLEEYAYKHILVKKLSFLYVYHIKTRIKVILKKIIRIEIIYQSYKMQLKEVINEE